MADGLVLPCGCAYTPGIDLPTTECAPHAADPSLAHRVDFRPIPTPEQRIALALECLQPVYELHAKAVMEKRWWRRRGPALGTVILAERVRKALTDDW